MVLARQTRFIDPNSTVTPYTRGELGEETEGMPEAFRRGGWPGDWNLRNQMVNALRPGTPDTTQWWGDFRI